MYVDFDVPSSKAGTTYRIEWWGLRRVIDYNHWWDPFRYVWGKAPQDDIVTLSGKGNSLEHTFWFDPSRNREDDPFTCDSYGVSIYEYNSSFHPGQAAAYVSVDYEYYSDLFIYYCTIDWDPVPSGLRSGYSGPGWVRRVRWTAPWPHGRPYYVEGWNGDVGTPRFDYERKCSREISLP